jgi:hypothetical protein
MLASVHVYPWAGQLQGTLVCARSLSLYAAQGDGRERKLWWCAAAGWRTSVYWLYDGVQPLHLGRLQTRQDQVYGWSLMV